MKNAIIPAAAFFVFYTIGFCVSSINPLFGLVFALILVFGGFGTIAFMLRAK